MLIILRLTLLNYQKLTHPICVAPTSHLGYFVGYAICKSYYEHATDKAKAIGYMINLDNEQIAELDKFLAASGYMQ